ncbi:TIGR01777 family oxidoreductase [Arthrobacter glacialis]|uniref:TIGR01777 family oxidoreductase n=1 Tax=Arthrobacter glacialis TaxID=1664 RepID=UPI000CD46236|nr:TIGR01777 family oxidoreductase [Arthrobacter glacialis]POH60195.1 TIGR01777 family protein [Arthrobacter glacialis]
MKTVVIAGASGFIGTHFRSRLAGAGWRVRTVGRSGDAVWGDTSAITGLLEGADLLINLAGKSVSCRYTPANTAEIIRSRMETTAELGRAVAACNRPPRDWFNASTGTIYRDARDRAQNEDDGELGSGFSVDVARGWEETFAAADTPQTRKIPLRITIAMGPGGGVMRPFNNLARLGLGGRMGDGQQKYSWIHVEDLFRAVVFLHEHRQITGPVNIAAPEVVTNKELMAAVRAANRVPFGLPTPAWLLKIGAVVIRTETELVLKSRWVSSGKLQDAGFIWQYPDLARALADISGRNAAGTSVPRASARRHA